VRCASSQGIPRWLDKIAAARTGFWAAGTQPVPAGQSAADAGARLDRVATRTQLGSRVIEYNSPEIGQYVRIPDIVNDIDTRHTAAAESSMDRGATWATSRMTDVERRRLTCGMLA
jgi:hypothetical protein